MPENKQTPWRTVVASLLVGVACGTALFLATQGLQAFTAETARRVNVRRQPRALPLQVALQTATGQTTTLGELAGRWLLVDFIYTRCTTYCTVQGGDFARLQDRLAQPMAAGRVALLSISFDPQHDGPVQLAAYQARERSRGAGWIAARPTNAAGLRALMRAFGVTAIADERGGYAHNAAINVVDPQGRLVDILDWDAAAQAERLIRRALPAS